MNSISCYIAGARRLPLPCPSSHDSGIVTLSAVASLDGVQKQRNGGSGNTNKIVNELKSSALKGIYFIQQNCCQKLFNKQHVH